MKSLQGIKRFKMGKMILLFTVAGFVLFMVLFPFNDILAHDDYTSGRNHVWAPYYKNSASAVSSTERRTYSNLYWDKNGADYLNNIYHIGVVYTHEHRSENKSFSGNNWYATNFIQPYYEREDDNGDGNYEEVEITWQGNSYWDWACFCFRHWDGDIYKDYEASVGWDVPNKCVKGNVDIEAEEDWYFRWIWPDVNVDLLQNNLYVPPYSSIGCGGGGGCPYVFVWNGYEYVKDNNLLPDSVRFSAMDIDSMPDVVDYYKLEQPLLPLYNKYRLLLREFQEDHDFFDQVQLLTIDHPIETHIGVSATGEIFTYKDPRPAITVTDNNGNDVSALVEKRGDELDFTGDSGDYLILEFESVERREAKLILSTDAIIKYSIHVQIETEQEAWETISEIHPRHFWAETIVDLSEFVNAKQLPRIRLFFTDFHKVDYVALDTTPQADIQIQKAKLVTAFHSQGKNVKKSLLAVDQQYAEIIPTQQIELHFTVPKEGKTEGLGRDFILITRGHYNKFQGATPSTSDIKPIRSRHSKVEWKGHNISYKVEVPNSNLHAKAKIGIEMSSINDLLAYRESIPDLATHLRSKGVKSAFSVITFRKPLSDVEFDSLVKKYKLKIHTIKGYYSSDEGRIVTVGGVPSPDGSFPREKIKKWLPKYDVSYGVTSVEATLDLASYRRMFDDPLVFLSDLASEFIRYELMMNKPLDIPLQGLLLPDVYWIAQENDLL